MCQAGLAVEQIVKSKQGNVNLDYVTLRAKTQEDNCTCLVFIENQSWSSFQMYIEPYGTLQSSAPKESECGMELYLEFYYMEKVHTDLNMDPIKCTSGQTARAFSLTRNKRVKIYIKIHVSGENGTLKIVCGVPGVIPSTRYTTPQSLDQFTISSGIDQSKSLGSPVNHSDDSTVYIASGASAGVVVIAATAIAIFFCKRHQSKRKPPVSIDNVNLQYDSLSEPRNVSNYSTLNCTQADNQQYELVETQT
ncbi:unnamed protein product [Mytilus coruscus]|uniref:Uncharacterized protein n=1 Tax=Mytilus coruscus TaxID=42192 RepID=A0A6J8EB79_MYTCO|nr:unnamed protein product [Mytilus coruscus]